MATVEIVARNVATVDEAVADLQAAGHDAVGEVLNVLDHEATADYVKANGPYQVAVINAGTGRFADTVDFAVADFEAVMDLNVNAAMFTAQAVIRGLLAAQLEGSLIFISSQMGHIGGPKRVAYCASKHAVEGMVKVMAWEYGKDGIRANSLAPTFTETDMTRERLQESEFHDFVIGNIALG